MYARITTLLATIAASATLACVQVHHHFPLPRTARIEKRGPPPHAPAHGYRHKQKSHVGEVQLVFDSDLGVYVVLGWPDHYYDHDYYYRLSGGVWQVSARLDGGWVAVTQKKLPPGLAKKGRGPTKGPHPASRRR